MINYYDTQQQETWVIKKTFIIIKNIAVGKSCILLQFTENKFREQHEITIGVEFEAKTIEIDGKLIKIQVWDTAGHEAFQSITRTYYKGAEGALLVYDITRKDTFNNVKKWLNELKENASKDIIIILIGNKVDLEEKREVTKDEGQEFADQNGLMFLETSAKTAQNILEAFNISARSILSNIKKNEMKPKENTNINLNKEKEKEKQAEASGNKVQKNKKGCC